MIRRPPKSTRTATLFPDTTLCRSAQRRGRLRVFVDIELDDLELAGILGGDLFEDRRNHATGAAPLRPEVDQHWLCVAGGFDVLFETRVRNSRNMFTHGLVPRRKDEQENARTLRKWGGSSLTAAAQKARQTGMINLYTTGK